jgi:hypothetical protein
MAVYHGRSTSTLGQMSYSNLNDPAFERHVTLREAYKIMERFVADFLVRGDMPISDFLHCFAGSLDTGQTTDPATIDDFLVAVRKVLDDSPNRD